MERYIFSAIKSDLPRKMVLVTGPRQVGKTHLAKRLMPGFAEPQYLNFDVPEDANVIRSRSWPLRCNLLIFDELHKMHGWKQYLKGVFDGRDDNQAILVTGSARMETFRQGGESLAGRYFHFHLLPFSVRELAGEMPAAEALAQLNALGGFPEPFLAGSADHAARWRNQYYTDLIREDILEFGRINELRAMKMLLEMLRSRTGSPLSFKAIAEDLQVAPQTVQRYVGILESLYIVFLIRPFHRNVARAILKEPKLYFYDTGLVIGDEGARLENTCAVSLLKHVRFVNDTTGKGLSLAYLRNKDGREVDFVLVEGETVRELIEVKTADANPAPPLIYFKERFFGTARCVQAVMRLRREQFLAGVEIRKASSYLAELDA
jgi:predicted AAA+ superfamily ATPase